MAWPASAETAGRPSRRCRLGPAPNRHLLLRTCRPAGRPCAPDRGRPFLSPLRPPPPRPAGGEEPSWQPRWAWSLPGGSSGSGRPAARDLLGRQTGKIGCASRRSGSTFCPPPDSRRALQSHAVRASAANRAAEPADRAANTALVAQRIEHLTTDQKVGGSNPSERAAYVQVRASQSFGRRTGRPVLLPVLLPNDATAAGTVRTGAAPQCCCVRGSRGRPAPRWRAQWSTWTAN